MITFYLANKYLDSLTAKVPSQQGAIVSTSYLGLSTTQPARAGGNVSEPVSDGYERTLIGQVGTAVLQKMTSAEDAETTYKDMIYFAEATGSWGECLYLCIFDHKTAGNLLAYSPILAPTMTGAGLTDLEIDYDFFAEKVSSTGGTYEFIYDSSGSTWKFNSSEVDLADYGIEVSGTPDNNDKIEIVFGITPTANQIPIIRADQLKITLR